MLKEEGYRVVLVNSNPATIMTDPEVADRTYLEPITPEVVAKILEKEHVDAILPTLGGQTALNVAVKLAEDGTLERLGVKLIGASLDAIKKAEDRDLFRETMKRANIPLPRSHFAQSIEEAASQADAIGYPVILRPSFTLGGAGGGRATDEDELRAITKDALRLSPTHTVLVEEDLTGWKEFELEVMRDRKDNAVIVCGIENLDPMGVHTGDSITVAPIQTLTDREYQRLRDMALEVLRAVGVDTGGSNVQFAMNPRDGRIVVIEMNPRVSRSSALASKATGFPIAKIAARLAVGYTLDEIANDITRVTPACFEPSLDYVVVKIPRWAFEKFPQASDTLGTRMKSVGEVMAIGRTFPEAYMKALMSLEIENLEGLIRGEGVTAPRVPTSAAPANSDDLARPTWRRPFQLLQALRGGAHAGATRRRDRHRPLVPRPHGGDRRHGARRPQGLPGHITQRPRTRGASACSAKPSATASATPTSPISSTSPRTKSARCARASGCAPSSRRSTPAPPSSRRRPPTSTPPTRRRTKARPSAPTPWSCSAAAPTASARGWSSTTAACARPRRCARPAARSSSSIRIRRRSPPITTPRTGSTSNRSPASTCSTFWRRSAPPASCCSSADRRP